MAKNFLLFFLFVLPVFCLAQDDELQPVEDIAGTIGSLLGSADGIEKVRVISETDESLSLEITVKGFKDKNYKVKGTILNKLKKPLKEIETVKKDLPKRSSTVELRFEFKQRSNRTYQTPYIESRFVSITICEADDSLCDFDLGDIDIFGNSYMYKLDTKWRIGGSRGKTNIVVAVKLIPYKSAATIKP